ncbi:ABC transporter substrate-binding protein [Rhodococcus hoagii]|nr:ABC transporter substrate-binding protein [Prescottella equi]
MKSPRLAAAVLLVSAALASSACGAGAGATQTGSTALTVGALNDVRSWDPAQAGVGNALVPFQAVYDTLILREPDGTLTPMLATDWNYNADGTVLTVDLRSAVTFSDGTVFDAAAAKANLDRFRAANGPQTAQLGAVEQITVVDTDTIAITLRAPDPALTYYLSQAAGLMGSPKALENEGIQTDPVGTGPYTLDKGGSVKGAQVVFSARQDYWNEDLQHYEKITLKVLPDITARTNALVSGQVDATLLSPKASKQAEGAGLEAAINQVDWQGLLLLDRDGTRNPALKDVRVRQAINHAFDRQTILDQVVLGEGTPTSQPFGKESGAWVEALENRYPYDPAKAKALLAEAGYASGLTIEVPAISQFETEISVVKQQLADVGIRLEVGAAIANTISADIAAQKYTSLYFSLFQGEPWVAINQLVAPTALYNPFETRSPELEGLIEAVRNGGSDSATPARAVNEYVVEQAWFAPLYRVNQMYYHNDKVDVTPQIQQAVPSIYNYQPRDGR